MDNSIGQTIEKIKLQEQDNEVKLKEKRELNNAILSLNRAIRDSSTRLGKLSKEYQCLTVAIDKLQHQLAVEKTRHIALVDQLNSCTKELEQIRNTCNNGVSAVWSKRGTLLETVQGIGDKCDIWALLIKPTTCNQLKSSSSCAKVVEVENNRLVCNEDKVKNAMEKRSKAIAERNYLLSEPEIGEEFIRRYTRGYRARRSYSSKLEEAAENEPIKFSTSPAARKTTRPVVRKVDTDMPWYQPFSVVGSVAVFLIYFCVLREENDVDLEFNKTLYERIKGLEKEQLLQSYRFNKEHGKSVDDIEKRLKEIETQENQVVA